MAGEDTRLEDARLDLLSIQTRALAAVREYGRYLRDAEDAGLPEFAYFVRQLMEESCPLPRAGKEARRRLGACRSQQRSCSRANAPIGRYLLAGAFALGAHSAARRTGGSC
jgi:hypothetical protein